MKVTLIKYTPDAERLLVYTKSTRLTQGTETRDKINNMTGQEIQSELDYMSKTIPSSWEFVDYVFEITGVSRAFTHQFVRTRTGSYAQQTHRMLDVKDFEYVTNPGIIQNPKAKEIYDNCMNQIALAYSALLHEGVAVEDARGVLPTNICTNIIAKFNLRTLCEIVKKRSSMRTQSEYRDVVDGMAKEVLSVHPWAEKFMYPDGKENYSMITAPVAKALAAGAITKDEAVQIYKAVDIYRNG